MALMVGADVFSGRAAVFNTRNEKIFFVKFKPIDLAKEDSFKSMLKNVRRVSHLPIHSFTIAGCENFAETKKELFVNLLQPASSNQVAFLDFLLSQNLYYFSLISREWMKQYFNVGIVKVSDNKINGNLFKTVDGKQVLLRCHESPFTKLTNVCIKEFLDQLLDYRVCQLFVVVYEDQNDGEFLKNAFADWSLILYKKDKFDLAQSALVEARMRAGNLPMIRFDMESEATCQNLPDYDRKGRLVLRRTKSASDNLIPCPTIKRKNNLWKSFVENFRK